MRKTLEFIQEAINWTREAIPPNLLRRGVGNGWSTYTLIYYS